MIATFIAMGIVLVSWLAIPVAGALTFRRHVGEPGRHRNWS